MEEFYPQITLRYQMIYSSIKDNWMRVEIMHSVAQSYYEATNDSDFRNRIIKGKSPFPFDCVQHGVMEKESCIVGMVMVWSVITLESLVNHSLAEILNNRTSAIMAIEYPRQVTDKLKIAKSARSELSKKLVILSDGDERNLEYLSLADKLYETRNQIVHDKPFDLMDFGDGEVEITHFRSRGGTLEHQLRYEDLGKFYGECDQIKNYVLSVGDLDVMGVDDMSFTALKNGQVG